MEEDKINKNNIESEDEHNISENEKINIDNDILKDEGDNLNSKTDSQISEENNISFEANEKIEENNIKDNNINNHIYENEDQDNFVKSDLKKYKDMFDDEKAKNKDYQWNYERYNKMDQISKDKSKKNKGAVVFAAILGTLIFTSIIVVGGTKIYKIVYDKVSMASNDVEKSLSFSDSNGVVNDNFIADNNSVIEKDSSDIVLTSNYPATQIAKKVIPSVVSIVPYARVQSFYQTGVTEIGNASGIIMRSDGYIVTNAHVVLKLPTVQPVDALKVILSNNKEYEAKIIGVDINTDLAIIKIEANNLPAAEFGNSDELEVGEPVFAIGSPLDVEFAGSMTSGIVSALNRNSGSDLSLGCDNKYIQTDAPINPGNSGGALVNIKGQVVGINARKNAGSDIEGMGFAIPTNQVKSVLEDLINIGHVQGRVRLGITVIKEIDKIISKLNNVKTGLVIESVEANPDLVKSGITQYDILHEINGKKVYSTQELKDEMKKYKPGDNVHLVFYRYNSFGEDEKKIEVNVKLIEDKGIFQK